MKYVQTDSDTIHVKKKNSVACDAFNLLLI